MRGWRVWAAGLMCVAMLGCETTPEPPVIQPRPAERLGARELPPASASTYRDLTSSSMTPPERMTAARRLLAMIEQPDPATPATAAAGLAALRASLALGQEPAVHRAVLEAIASDDDGTPPPLAPTMLSLLGEVDPSVSESLADALGRYVDPAVRAYLRDVAASPQAAVSRRSDAARALGRLRTQAAAGKLIQLIDPAEPTLVRDAAFDALAVLTGTETRGDDRAAWLAWWEQTGALEPAGWYRRLLANFTRDVAQRTLGEEHLKLRLLESQGALYRTTADEDRPAVLTYMLGDPLLPIRQLGMDLAVARLLGDKPFDEPLRQTLRDRLTDPAAALRARAALLLRDLADESAASIAAERLALDREPATAAREAYLRLLSRLPQPEAAEPALRMLADPALRGEAAGALAASYDAGHLTTEQADLAADRVRATLDNNPHREPEPQVVTLLGKVGAKADFERIARWVDSSNAAVKRAAAQSWADSDESLRLLAERANDPTIAPIVIDAAIRRGDDPAALAALVKRRPQTEQLGAAWERALVAMAARVAPSAVANLLPKLDTAADDRTLRERVLSSTIEANAPADSQAGSADGEASEGDAAAGAIEAAADADSQPQAPSALPRAERDALLALRLERGETRLALGEHAAAMEDFKKLDGDRDRLSDRQVDRMSRAWIRAALARGRFETAFDVARRLLGEAGPGDALGPTDDPIVDLFIESTKRQVQLGERDAARSILKRLRDLLGSRIKPEVAQRIALVEAQLGIDREQAPPAEASTDSTADANADAEPGTEP